MTLFNVISTFDWNWLSMFVMSAVVATLVGGTIMLTVMLTGGFKH